MGRLTHDPEFRQTQTGLPMCTFNIAIDRPGSGKNGQERVTDFFRILSWRNTAEFASKFFQKGSLVIVEGKVQNNNYTDQQGVKHYGMDIVADNLQFGETRAAAEARGLNVRPQGDGGGYQSGNYGNSSGYSNGGGNYQGNSYANNNYGNYQNGGNYQGNAGYQNQNTAVQPAQPIYANNTNNNYPRGGEGVAYTGITNASESQKPVVNPEPVSNGSVEDFNEIMSDGDVPF
ncbi:hypothetical protein FACS1894132_07630 [Clostridia bacterium]|nr:hypothetical protein FACS1894132_07630 [Clostridia bacterium]